MNHLKCLGPGCRSLLTLTPVPHHSLLSPAAALHTSPVSDSRIKRISRHKPMWHIKKLNKAPDEPMTPDNQLFIQEMLNDQYSGPLKSELAPWARGSWEPWTRRCGVIGVKIGVQPLWLKNGKLIMTTLLHVTDNHVVKFIPRGEYDRSYIGLKDQRPCFTGPGRAKGPNIHGMVVVGSHSTDPQRYTKDYCGLFSDAGLMPKRHLARFPITENALIQPGTSLTASHFSVGQWVDVYGRTIHRGFQGVMKRWGMAGMPATHGVTKSHRRPGCIGSGNDKSRVFPGQKMPGDVGGMFRWSCGLRVWRINHEESVLYVSGCSVPGNTGDAVQICDTRIPGKRWEALGRGPTHFPTSYSSEELDNEEWHEDIINGHIDPIDIMDSSSKVERSGVGLLKSWLNKNMKVLMSDGRVLVGIFLCTDKAGNVIIGSCNEFTSDPDDTDADADMEPRLLGLAMVPGHHIKTMWVDNNMTPARANSPLEQDDQEDRTNLQVEEV